MTTSGFVSSGSESLIERLRRATIGRYDIYAELGAGGMATVFLALDLALDRKVAIKVLSPALASSADNVERFKREAKVAASLSHPNIIGIYAVGDDPELAYFVMKYVEGRALDSVVRETGAQSLPFVRAVIGAAGRALHYAHSRGIVHRDVKPANFMLDKDGWLVVADFGIAKMGDVKGLTMTGAIVGTPHYMAPEQFHGKDVTAAADQYALGVVAFELLSGRQPYEGDSIAEVMKGHLFDPIPSLRSLRPDLPESVDATITKMLAKEPADRYASLEEAVSEFGDVTSTQEREVRTQMVNLALSAAMQQPQMHVPLSPLPAARTVPARTVPAAAALPTSNSARPRSFWPLILLALLLGGVAATAALRPTLLARLRGNSSVTPPNPPASRVADGEPVAQTPPITVDTAESAPSAPAQKVDPPARVPSQETPPRAGARVPTDTAVPAPAAPTEIPSSMIYGALRIGSRCPGAVLSIGGQTRPLGQRGLINVPQLSGTITVQIRTRGGATWDSTFTVNSGELHRVGFRPLRCR